MTNNKLFISCSGISQRSTLMGLSIRVHGASKGFFDKGIDCRLCSHSGHLILSARGQLSINGRRTTGITSHVGISDPRL